MKNQLIAATLVVGLLAHSVAGQKKSEAPAVQTPATFRGADPGAVLDQNSIGDLKWFEVFKDPELQKLVRTAMVRNYDLRAAVVRIDAARANLGLARSEQFPQVGVGSDLTSARASRNGQLGIANQGGRSRSF